MGHSAGYLHSKYPEFYNPDGSAKAAANEAETQARYARLRKLDVEYQNGRMRANLKEYLARMPESCRTQERLVIEDFLDWLGEKR